MMKNQNWSSIFSDLRTENYSVKKKNKRIKDDCKNMTKIFDNLILKII